MKTEFDIGRMLRCAERELAMRRKVYPRLVTQGKMTPMQKLHEIEDMYAIREFLKQHAGEAFDDEAW